jgi:hypothetical protein
MVQRIRRIPLDPRRLRCRCRLAPCAGGRLAASLLLRSDCCEFSGHEPRRPGYLVDHRRSDLSLKIRDTLFRLSHLLLEQVAVVQTFFSNRDPTCVSWRQKTMLPSCISALYPRP